MCKEPAIICNWCNQPSIIIWIHGHGQCSVCGLNIDECCRGEEALPPDVSMFVSQDSNVDKLETEKDKIEND